MESPLDFFRRNQKTMLPIIAIGCMVAFVVLPGLLGLLAEKQHQNSDKNPVLYRWQGGELRQRDLQQEINDHERLAYLYARVELEKELTRNPLYRTIPDMMRQGMVELQNQFKRAYPGPTNFTSAADAKIFDQLAKELGIVISDRQVDEFLHEICGQPAVGPDGKPTGKFQTIVPAATFDAIMQDMAKMDPGFTQDRMFDLMKRMFARREVEQLFSLGNVYAAETPLARWENYRRIRQRASIQAIPVAVSDYVSAVREPTSEELTAFFEASKNRLPDPNSAEVGLRTPPRASFQVAFLDMERLVSSFKPRIDNKAISDYYEKNKATRYIKTKLPTVDPSKPSETKPADPAAPMTPEAKPAESKPADAGAKDAPKSEPAKTEPAKTEPAKTEPAKAEPAKTEPAKTEPEAPKTDAPKKQSSLTRDGLLPVNFQADEKKEPAKDAPKAAEPAAKDAAKEPAKSEPAKEEPAKSEPVEYVPLADVEGEIRTLLATEQANAQADLLMQKIEDAMAAYKKSRDRALIKAEDASTVKFDDFDLAKVTAAIDPTIEAETLALVSRDQFLKHPVSATQAAFLQGGPILGDVAYSEKYFPLYEPIRPRSFTGRYLIWKTEQRGDEIPSLSDKAVREKTIAAWKMVEARKDAKKQADRYAEIVREANKAKPDDKASEDDKDKKEDKYKTLLELYDAKVLPVSPTEISGFSWITLPTQPRERPSVSKVSGLDKAGNELMKEIFNLKQGQVGVAPNQPKSVYYVVQVTKADDLTKLNESFMQDVRTPEGWSQFSAANFDQQMTEARSFYDRLHERYKLVPTDNQPFIVGNEQQ